MIRTYKELQELAPLMSAAQFNHHMSVLIDRDVSKAKSESGLNKPDITTQSKEFLRSFPNQDHKGNYTPLKDCYIHYNDMGKVLNTIEWFFLDKRNAVVYNGLGKPMCKLTNIKLKR